MTQAALAGAPDRDLVLRIFDGRGEEIEAWIFGPTPLVDIEALAAGILCWPTLLKGGDLDLPAGYRILHEGKVVAEFPACADLPGEEFPGDDPDHQDDEELSPRFGRNRQSINWVSETERKTNE